MSELSVLVLSLIRGAEQGIVRGITAGFKYEQQDQKILAWAFDTGNNQALSEAVAVGRQWGKETYDEFDNILPAVTGALQAALVGQTVKVDPWATSRAMTQALWQKWAGPAGLAAVSVPVAVHSMSAGDGAASQPFGTRADGINPNTSADGNAASGAPDTAATTEPDGFGDADVQSADALN